MSAKLRAGAGLRRAGGGSGQGPAGAERHAGRERWAGCPDSPRTPRHAYCRFGEAEEGIAAIASDVATGSSADLAAGHLAADSFSEPLVCSGISGRSSTISNSAWHATA